MCRSRPEAKIHPRPRRGCKVCRKTGSHIGPAVAAGYGVTRGRSDGVAGGRAVRGNSPQPVAGGSRGSERVGKPAGLPSALTEDAICGQPRTHQEASQQRRCGETRRFIVCDAQGLGIRGNSKLHRRHSGKMQPRGNSRTHREAERDDAWSEQPVVHRDRGARDSGFWRLCFF